MDPMHRLSPPLRRLLLFAPSLLLGVIGGAWLWWRPAGYEARVGAPAMLLAGALLAAALLTGAWLLEKWLPSFRYASRMMERALARLPLGPALALTLAAATAVSEELFFRGALQSSFASPTLGVWVQAALFGLLHPATRRGWSYTAYTFVAGLAFGYVTVWAGSLWPALLAHFAVNLQGFWEVARSRRRRRATGSGD